MQKKIISSISVFNHRRASFHIDCVIIPFRSFSVVTSGQDIHIYLSPGQNSKFPPSGIAKRHLMLLHLFFRFLFQKLFTLGLCLSFAAEMSSRAHPGFEIIPTDSRAQWTWITDKTQLRKWLFVSTGIGSEREKNHLSSAVSSYHVTDVPFKSSLILCVNVNDCSWLECYRISQKQYNRITAERC